MMKMLLFEAGNSTKNTYFSTSWGILSGFGFVDVGKSVILNNRPDLSIFPMVNVLTTITVLFFIPLAVVC